MTNPRQTTNVDKFIGLRIRAARKNMKLTQSELAERCDISPQQLQKYETGFNRISASRLLEISDVTGVPVHDFFADVAAEAEAKPETPLEKVQRRLELHTTDSEPFWIMPSDLQFILERAQ